MKKVVFLAVPVLLLLVAGTAWCHQTRIVEGEDITPVENPEVSQAFYGELKGEPASYQIASEDPFKLYVGILVPDLENSGKDVSVEITREHTHPEEAAKQEPEEEEMHVVLDGTEHEWTHWYEPFGGDWYWEGPELRSNPPEEELPLECVLQPCGSLSPHRHWHCHGDNRCHCAHNQASLEKRQT